MGSNKVRDPRERFYEKIIPVAESGCWLWIAHILNNGYGQFWDGDKLVLAHRFSYALSFGELGGMDVLHKCDVPSCVNPAHLFLGSHADNMADMARKGRSNREWKVRGSDATPSRLSADQVLEIRKLYASGGHSQRKIAAMFGVSQPAIKCITRRQVWRHI